MEENNFWKMMGFPLPLTVKLKGIEKILRKFLAIIIVV